MKPITLNEKIAVMKAYADGKTVESCLLDNPYEDEWMIEPVPSWNWEKKKYRINIKPEKKKRPMTFEEIVAYWKQHRTEIYTVTYPDTKFEKDECVIIGADYDLKKIKTPCYNFIAKDFVEHFTKEDGSKFEVEVEE